jgi:hypothetical protein
MARTEEPGLLRRFVFHALEEAQRLRHEQLLNVRAIVSVAHRLVASVPVHTTLGAGEVALAAGMRVVVDSALEVTHVLVESARQRRVRALVESQVPLHPASLTT